MQTLTQEEITYIKKLYSDDIKNQEFMIMDNKIQRGLEKVVEKYQPLLDKAEAEGDLENRKILIEEMTLEAKAKEEEIRNN